MKKRNLFSLFMMLLATAVMAQSVPTHEMYVDKGEPADIVKALDEWVPGEPWNRNSSYKDENFWISRVPLKNRFRPGDYANDALNDENNKKFCWCAPTGEMTSKWGALPRYNFDGDNFNMWQYLDIHSNWTNGFWRVPGAFNDVAHKNGVKTGCTYFIDWGGNVNSDSEPGLTLYRLAEDLKSPNSNGDKFKYSRKLIQFLKYYGIDGLCFNPEGTWNANVYNRVIPFLAECHKIAEELNHPFHVDWYSFVMNNGYLSDNGCKLTDANQNWFQYDNTPVTDMFFLNYNWTRGGLEQSVQTARNLGRSSFDVYAGFDMQGRGYGQGSKAGTNAGWQALMENPVSIVIWGAHDRNQLYISSTEGGQSDYAVQNEYQKKQEMLFSGGNRNVLNLPDLNTEFEVTSSYSDLEDWHGYAKAVIERSTLDEVPFVTRFNLGNGRFFNNEGVTTWNHKWYNYGMQDFLPTWRWWIDNGDGKTVPADAVNLDFTFDDAWFGGSCLKVHGATTRSDVRLFATKWNVANGDDYFRLVFKPNSNATHLELMVAKENGENNFVYIPVAGEINAGEWNEVVIKASEAGLAAGDVVGCVGLSVKDTDAAFEVLLGELAYIPAGFNATPKRPTIEYSEVIKRYYNRADIKVVFSMPEPATRESEYEGCPIYNEEVDTWYYEIWIRQGKEETLLTTTTSWAAYVVDATIVEGSDAGIRIGVRAVGLDGRAKSDIRYGDVLNKELSIIETLTVDKDIIKPGEKFTIGFEDPNHAPAEIKLYNAITGEVVVESEGKTLAMTATLPEIGSYDVEVITSGVAKMNRSLILVSPEETGRYPEIKTMVADKSNVDAGNVGYTATINKGNTYNNAPCSVSQSLYMQEPYQFTVDAAIMEEYTNTSFALWFKVEKFEHASLGTLLMTKVNRNYEKDWGGTWTDNVWGEMWTAIRPAGYATNNNIGRNNAENELSLCTDAPPAGTSNYEHNRDVDILSNGYSLMPGVWYHVCAVKQGKKLSLYLNGMLIAEGTARGAGPKDWKGAKFYVGGSMTNLASLTGWVDEVQIWSKALTQDEVKEAMKGYQAPPANLEGYFTFENTLPDEEGYIYFPNMGRNKSVVPGGYMTTGKEENKVNTDYKQNQFTTALGVPMITGVYPINYESSKWFVEGAKLNGSTETTAEIKFDSDVEYQVKLVATNSWGSTTKVVNDCIVVTAIDDVAANEAGYMIYPKPFERVANVLFAKGGVYDISIYAADGKLVAKDYVDVSDSEVCEISVEKSGTYIVVISKDGKAVRSFKIVM
ncbi:MAG: T9SS type A sorting domain-containing protein [Bacteroidaceae bacterium]|nr:T9SS type A sorting domain-containing protein [Bacteroidaceae bacterium]